MGSAAGPPSGSPPGGSMPGGGGAGGGPPGGGGGGGGGGRLPMALRERATSLRNLSRRASWRARRLARRSCLCSGVSFLYRSRRISLRLSLSSRFSRFIRSILCLQCSVQQQQQGCFDTTNFVGSDTRNDRIGRKKKVLLSFQFDFILVFGYRDDTDSIRDLYYRATVIITRADLFG